ncbi:MAG: PilN domain-containing protein [Bacillota bacterium]
MKDFNFFSPYIEQKSTTNKKHSYFIIAGAVIAAFALAFFAFNIYRISSMQKQLKQLEAYLNSEVTQKSLAEYKLTQEKVKVLKEYQSMVEDVNRRIDINDRINTELLGKLNENLPRNVFLEVISIQDDIVQLQGISKDRIAIAECVYKLKQNKVFKSVLIENINKVSEGGSSYTFNLVCELGVSE